ncbi:hypothetical protein [Thermocrinis sp.]
MRYILLSIILLVLNFLYSAYSLKIARDYVNKTMELKRESEERLLLKVRYSKAISYPEAKRWTHERGFVPVNWEKVNLID